MSRIQCLQCDKTYAGKGGLKQHMDTHHPADGVDLKYPCEFCDRNHLCSKNLNQHLLSCKSNPERIKPTEAKYRCDECDKVNVCRAFKQNDALIKHCQKDHGIARPIALRTANSCCLKMKSDRFNILEFDQLFPKPKRWSVLDTLTGNMHDVLMCNANNKNRCEIMNIIYGIMSDYSSDAIMVETYINNKKLACPKQIDIIDISYCAINELVITELLEYEETTLASLDTLASLAPLAIHSIAKKKPIKLKLTLS